MNTELLEKVDSRVRREVKAINNIRLAKGAKLLFENGCLVDTVESVELVAPSYIDNRPNYRDYCTELLIFLSGKYSEKVRIVTGEDLVAGKVKIVKDRKYKTISVVRYSF